MNISEFKLGDEVKGTSLSHGTLNVHHLLERSIAFMFTFKEGMEKLEVLKANYNVMELSDFYNEETEMLEVREECWEDIEIWFNQIAPEKYYFGNTEGDGSDFGWWEVSDE